MNVQMDMRLITNKLRRSKSFRREHGNKETVWLPMTGDIKCIFFVVRMASTIQKMLDPRKSCFISYDSIC
jgi:hypothetical protein